MWWVQLLNNIAALLGGGVAASTSSFESIATFTATGGETSVTFSSIPSTYSALQIRGIGRRNNGTTGLDVEYLRINGDSGSNYAYHQLYGNGTSALANASSATTLISAYMIPRAGELASTFGAFVIDIQNYASTTQNKTVRSFFGVDLNGSGQIYLASGLWVNTSAITSLQLDAAADPLAAGSTFALYGIKGA